MPINKFPNNSLSNSQNKFGELTVWERRILQKIKRIPRGKVTTYKFLAEAVNRPKAIRAVGNALKKNPCLIKVPCHRVVKLDGKIGGYCLGQKRKLSLLKKEGVEFTAKNQVKNFKEILYRF